MRPLNSYVCVAVFWLLHIHFALLALWENEYLVCSVLKTLHPWHYLKSEFLILCEFFDHGVVRMWITDGFSNLKFFSVLNHSQVSLFPVYSLLLQTIPFWDWQMIFYRPSCLQHCRSKGCFWKTRAIATAKFLIFWKGMLHGLHPWFFNKLGSI